MSLTPETKRYLLTALQSDLESAATSLRMAQSESSQLGLREVTVALSTIQSNLSTLIVSVSRLIDS